MTGPYAPVYWSLITCNIVCAAGAVVQAGPRQPGRCCSSRRIVVLVGMWLERYVIIVSSLAQDFLPSSWGIFQATRWDWATYLGTIGLFLFLFFLFIRLLPMISIFEVRTLLPQAKVGEGGGRVTQPIYGLMAEFDNPTALVNAARAAREKGYRKLDAYSPFPIEELSDALHLHKNKLPLIVLAGGILGGLTGYLLQYYVTVWHFPINVGGRPLHSWPAYIVITFEMTILFAADFGGAGPAGAVRLAHALPSGVQRAAVRAGLAQPLLPVHRGRRPAVRPRRDQRFPGDSGAERGVRSCAVKFQVDPRRSPP